MFDEWRAATDGPGGTEEVVEVPGKPAAFAGEEVVQYRASFDDPRDPDDDVVCLALNGCYAGAEIEVTGEVLGEGDAASVESGAYFDPVRIPFRPSDENEVVVTCEAPSDRFGGLHDTDRVPAPERVPGIWWTAQLETHSLPYVDEMRVRPEVTGDDARLHVRTTVVTDGPLEDRVTYSVKPEGELKSRGMMQRGTVQAATAGKTTVEHTVDLRDPARWWPAGYGDQHLYRVRASLADSEHAVTTGVCEVERDGEALVVNGQRVPIRGVTLETSEPADVERAREVNATLVRAHAHVLPPSVYEACDEAGVLVWQDLPLTGPGDFDVDRATGLGTAIADAVAGHPSFAALSVHDDPLDVFGDGLGGGVLDSLRLRWRTWRSDYDRAPAEAVAAAVATDRPVIPVVGGPGTDPDAVTLYPGWDYGGADAVDDLLDRYPAPIVAEFGAAALADETVESAAGFDRDRHDRHVTDATLDASQDYQAAVLQTVAESLRLEGRGAIVHALRDTDAAGMGVYGADGDPKAGRDALARAFSPIQAFLADPSPGETEVLLRNDGPRSVTADVTVEAGDETEDLDATVAAPGRWTGGPVTVPGDAESVTLTVVVGEATVENRYDL
jgi:hypothetical protein